MAYHYRVTDNLIVSRCVSKKISNNQALIEYLKSVMLDCKPICVNEVDGNTLLEKAENMIDYEDDIVSCNWFMSDDKDTAIACAVIHLLSTTKAWDVMDNEEVFSNWIKNTVR